MGSPIVTALRGIAYCTAGVPPAAGCLAGGTPACSVAGHPACLFVMSPHSNDFNNFIIKDLIHKAVLNIDPAGIRPFQISD